MLLDAVSPSARLACHPLAALAMPLPLGMGKLAHQKPALYPAILLFCCCPCLPPVPPVPAEVYVDATTYAFTHGSNMLAILTNGNYSNGEGGNRRPATYKLAKLTRLAGLRLCDGLHSRVRGSASRSQEVHACVPCKHATTSRQAGAVDRIDPLPPISCLPARLPAHVQYCVTVDDLGSVEVKLSPTNEPLLLVPREWQKSKDFFQLPQHRSVRSRALCQCCFRCRRCCCSCCCCCRRGCCCCSRCRCCC